MLTQRGLRAAGCWDTGRQGANWGKKMQHGTDIDEEGDDQHDDGQLQVWVFNGIQQGHLQREADSVRWGQATEKVLGRRGPGRGLRVRHSPQHLTPRADEGPPGDHRSS